MPTRSAPTRTWTCRSSRRTPPTSRSSSAGRSRRDRSTARRSCSSRFPRRSGPSTRSRSRRSTRSRREPRAIVTSLDVATDAARRPFPGRRARLGDLLLQGAAGIAALGALVLVGLILWKVIQGARLALSTFGLGFVWHNTWDPVHHTFGAGSLLYGTVVTSVGALLLATPIAIGIALFLSELAPRGIRGPVTALVETLAAIPSVVIGLWGILVLAYTRGGVGAAMILGFGRAIGEAIAVALVIGAVTGISVNLFNPGYSLAGIIANNAQGASSGLETSALIGCALILLFFSILVNLLAQLIVRRSTRRLGGHR